MQKGRVYNYAFVVSMLIASASIYADMISFSNMASENVYIRMYYKDTVAKSCKSAGDVIMIPAGGEISIERPSKKTIPPQGWSKALRFYDLIVCVAHFKDDLGELTACDQLKAIPMMSLASTRDIAFYIGLDRKSNLLRLYNQANVPPMLNSDF